MVNHLSLLRGRLFVGRVLLAGQRSFGHPERVFCHGARASSATFPEPLPAQVEDLTKSEEDTHEAGHHHENSEYFLLCGPEQHKIIDVR